MEEEVKDYEIVIRPAFPLLASTREKLELCDKIINLVRGVLPKSIPLRRILVRSVTSTKNG